MPYSASRLMAVLTYCDVLLSAGTLGTNFLMRKIVGDEEKCLVQIKLKAYKNIIQALVPGQ